ncbi:MAG TPA: hypothetical protein VJO13_03090 [Ktedonobacterales bacterium]|nr:hypothetical protein [Ktedonobacterales bacterium]
MFGASRESGIRPIGDQQLAGIVTTPTCTVNRKRASASLQSPRANDAAIAQEAYSGAVEVNG